MNPFYLVPSGGRKLFALHFPARSTRRGAVLLLPPWGEEMHKSRHVLSRTARKMAQRGFDVLMFDLYGTGDSEGDFADASWALWQGDCQCARAWLAANFPGPLWVWTLRSGSLLLTALLEGAPVAGVLLWQPVVAGKSMLTQLLRLRLASTMASGGGMNTAPLLEALQRGDMVEIAGNMHAPELLLPLEHAGVELSAAQVAKVMWFELASRAQPEVLPASRRVIDAWRSEGMDISAQALRGPAFWHSTELEFCPELEAQSVAWLETAA